MWYICWLIESFIFTWYLIVLPVHWEWKYFWPETHLSRAVDSGNLHMICVIGWVQGYEILGVNSVESRQRYLRYDDPWPRLLVPPEQQHVLHHRVESESGPGESVVSVWWWNNQGSRGYLWCSWSSCKLGFETRSLSLCFKSLSLFTCEVDDSLWSGDTVGCHTLVLTKIPVTWTNTPHQQRQLGAGELGDGEVGRAGQLHPGHPVPHHVDWGAGDHRAEETDLQSGAGAETPLLLDCHHWRISCKQCWSNNWIQGYSSWSHVN